MKFRTVILKCKVNEIVHIRERLDEIAAVTEGKIWFETILQSESGTYAIVCHYPDSNLDMFADYIKNKNTLHLKISELEKVIEALTGRPANEIVKNYNICDNGFGVNYRRREKSILGELAELKKENEELKKRLKSAEQSDYVTPLRDRVDVCEEKINEIIDKANEHEEDLDNAYTDLDIVQDKMKTLEADLDDAKRRYLNDQKDLEERLDTDFDDVYAEFQSTKDQVNDINMGYIKWSSEVSQFDERIEKLENTVKGLNSIVATLGERNGVLSDKLDNYKEAYMHLDNADEALERRITALEMKLSSFVEGYNSTLDRMNLFARELDSLSTAIDNQGKDIRQIMQGRHYDNKGVNNTIMDLNNRLNALEKRLNIKPFYAPTEDEKDDD